MRTAVRLVFAALACALIVFGPGSVHAASPSTNLVLTGHVEDDYTIELRDPDGINLDGPLLIQSSGELVEMKEQGYVSEDKLQQLLASYPNLLAGDQMDSVAPRRWLLISDGVRSLVRRKTA